MCSASREASAPAGALSVAHEPALAPRRYPIFALCASVRCGSAAARIRVAMPGGNMLTLYGFGNIFEGGHGETKDMRVQWALEEIGLAYRVHALDQAGGELDSDAYTRISPFRQVPVIDDDGFIVAESGAIVLYLAEKAGKLIPRDVQGRTHVVQWCFAAASTLGSTT